MDHLSLEINFCIKKDLHTLLAPKPKINFKTKLKLIDSEDFQEILSENFASGKKLLTRYKYDIIDWWEYMVKPGIKKDAVLRLRK